MLTKRQKLNMIKFCYRIEFESGQVIEAPLSISKWSTFINVFKRRDLVRWISWGFTEKKKSNTMNAYFGRVFECICEYLSVDRGSVSDTILSNSKIFSRGSSAPGHHQALCRVPPFILVTFFIRCCSTVHITAHQRPDHFRTNVAETLNSLQRVSLYLGRAALWTV